jgi:signal transduction histidine kinase
MTNNENLNNNLSPDREKGLQPEKMEALSRFAGNIAHTFNNILTTVMGYLDLLSMDDSLVEDSRDFIEEMKKTTNHAASLTHQLLIFSRKEPAKPTELDLNEIIAGLEEGLKSMLRENIRLNINPAPNLPSIRSDPGKVEQIIAHLAKNSQEAMGKDGKFTLETKSLNLSECSEKHPDIKPGKYTLLIVSDSGCGIDDDVKAQIFEPFYTTKEKFGSAGLGLSTVYGLVRQMEGSIRVSSKAGEGTIFTIYIPAYKESAGNKFEV